MSWQLVSTALAPLLGLFIISLGSGFISSLTTLKLDAAGESTLMIGVVSSFYFIGLTLGALFSDRLIVKIGHIRAYSSFASLIAVTVLLQGMFFDPWAWVVLRLLCGWATLGVFLAIESWLLLAADQKMRGRLLALYMIALYGAGMIGQAKLGDINALSDTAPFMLAGLLAALSVLPIVIIPRTSPPVGHIEPLMPHRLIRMTPSGVMGCFGSGVAIAAVYTLLPLYLQRVGMNIEQIGHMMAATILGAMLLQYPVGRWSDMQNRQVVMIALSAACIALSLAILVMPASPHILAVLLFLLGGCIFSVYPVAISHATDNTSPDALIPMIQGLLLINSLGSAVSPLLITPVMAKTGASGLFWSFCLLNIALVVFFIWRRNERPADTPTAAFTAAAQMSPASAELRVTEELAQASQDYEAEQGNP